MPGSTDAWIRWIAAVALVLLCAFGVSEVVAAADPLSLAAGLALTATSLTAAVAAIVEPIWVERRRLRRATAIRPHQERAEPEE